MSSLPYHKRYHGDALTGFMALTLEERGAYQTLLDMIYDRGGPILDDERLLAGYMKCSLRKWRALRDELIAKRKIRITRDGHITNDRAEKEIENSAKTSRKLAENGSKGGRNRAKIAEVGKKGKENNEDGQAPPEGGLSGAQAIRASLPEARDQKKSSDTEVSGVPPADPVKELFDLGVSILMAAGHAERQARSLVGKWRKGHSDEDVAVAIVSAREKSDPVSWIQGRLDRQSEEQGDYLDIVGRKYAGMKPVDMSVGGGR